MQWGRWQEGAYSQYNYSCRWDNATSSNDFAKSTLKSLTGGKNPRDGKIQGWEWSVSDNNWADIRTTKSYVISIISPHTKEGDLHAD